MNGLLDPEAYYNDVNFHRDRRPDAYDAPQRYIDRFGKPLGVCGTDGCTATAHHQSDSGECADHTLIRWINEGADGGMDAEVAAEMERWRLITEAA